MRLVPLRAFGDLLRRTVLHALAHHPAIDILIVQRAIDLTALVSELMRRDRHHLPIREMYGNEDHALAAGDGGVGLCSMFSSRDRELWRIAFELEFSKVTVFRDGAAEIVPHLDDDGFTFGIAHLRVSGR